MSGWPNPLPLKELLPPVMPFDTDLLPDALRTLVVDLADRMQVPIDYLAIAGILSLAGAVGARARIQPKSMDRGWLVVPNLWGAIVGPPGIMKSPVMRAMTQPLLDIESRWHAEHRKAGKRVVKKLVVNDATPEALQEVMRDNPAGVLVIRDELTGWLADLDKPGRESERGFHLTSWNGDSSYKIFRIKRGEIIIPQCCESILAGIQSKRLKQCLLGNHVSKSSIPLQDDGLLQRFQLLVRPDAPKRFEYVDRSAHEEAAMVYQKVINRLVNIDMANAPIFTFAPDAQLLFQNWYTDLQCELREERLAPIMISHFSKYPKLMPALALLCELTERAAASSDGFVGFGAKGGQSLNTVSIENAVRAVQWCEYLRSHAGRIYSPIVAGFDQAANLAKKILDRKIGIDGTFTTREVYKSEWSGLALPQQVESAVRSLIQANWLREGPLPVRPNGGRPSVRYLVNPKVHELSSLLDE